MPRYPRLFLPDIPLHVVQRGHDRQVVFVQPDDYRYYLDNLREAKDTLAVRVHGYCLITNHVHLILTPGQETENVSKCMRLLAGRQTRYGNKLENRTGTLWESRFKASLIDSTAYLLACCRYVDLNPMRATMVASPDEYLWSSYRGHAAIVRDDLLNPCSAYKLLGRNRNESARAYREFVAAGAPDEELTMIRTAVKRNLLPGGARFNDAIEKRAGRRLSTLGLGRPRVRK